MAMEPEQHSNDPQLDDLITRMVESTEIPQGLADRVFDASAPGLPGRRSLEFPPAKAGINVALWGRVAMAAMFVIACVVAARLMFTSGTATRTASRDGETNAEPIVHMTPLSGDEELLLFDRRVAWTEDGLPEEGEIAYLIEARQTSYDDLQDEFEALDEALADLESEPTA